MFLTSLRNHLLFSRLATEFHRLSFTGLMVMDTKILWNLPALLHIPESKVHGANMGPTWVLSAPDGPHVGPVNLAIRAPYRQPDMGYCLCTALKSMLVNTLRPEQTGCWRLITFKPMCFYLKFTSSCLRVWMTMNVTLPQQNQFHVWSMSNWLLLQLIIYSVDWINMTSKLIWTGTG